ncbi:MAG TPA: CoA pyrophosphatase [Burkholderiaceae bacterium]|nr:CoA pyrophosphatase [Burkholderiaceae bacterium]
MTIDPRLLPLDRSFEELRVRGEAIAAPRLSPGAVRARFSKSLPWAPELQSDVLRSDQAKPRKPAAVLIPLIQSDDQLTVLLTQRARHLHDHAGQISFPGGRIEPSDRGPAEAALREAAEETGLSIERIELLGMLPVYSTITRFDVTPVVGMIAAPVAVKLDASEVEDAFEVPLAFLMDPGNQQRRIATAAGEQRFVYTIPYHDGSRERMIWGVTAAVLRNLYAFLRVD